MLGLDSMSLSMLLSMPLGSPHLVLFLHPPLLQAIEGTPFTAARPDQPYFPFLLANLGAPRMTQERESVINDCLG